MNLKEAVEIMQAHNEWRRGAETEMVDAKDLGRAIDVLISHAMKSQPTTSVSAEEFLKTRKEFYASDGKFEATDEFGEGLVAAAMHDFASRKPAGMRWVKASDRLPILPDPLPKDTIDERGILFVNRVHSAGAFWYPSYGVSAISFLNNYNGWNINDWEWLDEPEYSLDNGLGTTTVYGGKPAGEGYSEALKQKLFEWLTDSERIDPMEATVIIDHFERYATTTSNWIEIKEGEEKPG